MLQSYHMAIGREAYTKKLLRIRIGVFVVGILCALLAWSVWERITIERTMAERRAAAEVEYEALQVRHEELAEKVEYLTDERNVESEIRKHFDVAKAGEQVVIITDNQVETDNQPRSTTTEVARPWWRFW